MKNETRFLKVDNVEIRKITEGEEESEQRFVSGTGIVYGEEVEIWDGFKETIRAGAFTESINSGNEIKSYFNHNASFVLSTTESNPTLVLKDETKNLFFESPIPPTTYGNDLTVNLERGNVRGASFSFTVQEDILVEDDDGVYHREIVKGTLYEVGPVTNPAYPQTEVGARAKEDAFDEAKARIKKQQEEEHNSSGSDLEYYNLQLNIIELS